MARLGRRLRQKPVPLDANCRHAPGPSPHAQIALAIRGAHPAERGCGWCVVVLMVPFVRTTHRLGGRFEDSCHLRLSCSGSVCLASGYSSTSPVSAPFWHAAGTGRLSMLVTLCLQNPLRVSRTVHGLG